MAMIKCPECGAEISDRAGTCIHCGCPLQSQVQSQTEEGTLVIYGYTGWFLVKPSLQIYKNGEYIGDVSYKAKTKEIPIVGPTEIEIKCGIRSTLVRVPPYKHSEIHAEFNTFTGSIMAEIRSY